MGWAMHSIKLPELYEAARTGTLRPGLERARVHSKFENCKPEGLLFPSWFRLWMKRRGSPDFSELCSVWRIGSFFPRPLLAALPSLCCERRPRKRSDCHLGLECCLKHGKVPQVRALNRPTRIQREASWELNHTLVWFPLMIAADWCRFIQQWWRGLRGGLRWNERLGNSKFKSLRILQCREAKTRDWPVSQHELPVPTMTAIEVRLLYCVFYMLFLACFLLRFCDNVLNIFCNHKKYHKNLGIDQNSGSFEFQYRKTAQMNTKTRKYW